jgi:hypothetical protein
MKMLLMQTNNLANGLGSDTNGRGAAASSQ